MCVCVRVCVCACVCVSVSAGRRRRSAQLNHLGRNHIASTPFEDIAMLCFN